MPRATILEGVRGAITSRKVPKAVTRPGNTSANMVFSMPGFRILGCYLAGTV